jgi:redox-sensitive bicupin YhaK (pirin superfamily)
MMRVRKAEDRCRHGDAWLTFEPWTRSDPQQTASFGVLTQLTERELAPGERISESLPPAEILTYVREGALAYDDSVGRSAIVHAGEFQRICVEHGVQHREKNASSTATAQIFRIALRLPEGRIEHRHERARFTAAQRRNQPCLVASHDGRNGSLRLHQDVRIFSAILLPGRHMVHELRDGHAAWLHVVSGSGTLHGTLLDAGDGAGVTLSPSISFTAQGDAELLLIELVAARRMGNQLPIRPPGGGR